MRVRVLRQKDGYELTVRTLDELADFLNWSQPTLRRAATVIRGGKTPHVRFGGVEARLEPLERCGGAPLVASPAR